MPGTKADKNAEGGPAADFNPIYQNGSETNT